MSNSDTINSDMQADWVSEDGSIRLFNRDCLEVLPHLSGVDAVISDPPFGMGWQSNQRFSGGKVKRGKGTIHSMIIGDNEPFDPTPWLKFQKVVLWGANHYWNKLPAAACLVWQKRNEDALGSFLSDGEIAYMSVGVGVYIFQKVFAGSSKAMEGGIGAYDGSLHPNQKPISLMAWCMDMAKVPVGETVLDPYAGSCSTGVACIRTGRRFVGIERDPTFFKIAVDRIKRELAQGNLFPAAALHAPQPEPTLL